MADLTEKINRIANNVSDTYAVLSDLGAEMPEDPNSDNLARTAAGVSAVLYGKEQNLTEEQKEQARRNIGVLASSGGVNIIMSETDPGNLAEGDYWHMVMTEYEAPREMCPFTVTLKNGTGYTVAAANGSISPVYRGDSFSFSVTIANGYQTSANFAVKANGNTLSAVNGVYTITNINGDQTVTVEGVVETPKVATVNITGTGNTTYCYATINGTKQYGAASNIEVEPGDTITFGVYGRSSSYVGTVTIDGSEVLRVTNQQTQTYNWTVPTGTKTISINMSYTSTTNQRRGTITVTTTK